MDRRKDIWDGSPRVNTFEQTQAGSDAARYLGLPLAASYRLVLHKNRCLYNGSGLTIYIAAATDTPGGSNNE